MYKIQTNPSGTRSLEVTETNLITIRDYSLFQDLIDSTGIVDEDVLNKLKMNIRSLLDSQEPIDRNLMELCMDVIYHDNMKAFGLHQLVMLYINWLNKVEIETTEVAATES